jgi:phosphopantetheinyl transferase (holo-ACP synthase)
MMWLRLVLGASAQETVEPPDKYGTSLLKLATRFAAKEACSCVFVTGRDQDECALYLRVSPDIAGFKVDPDAKTVTAKALGGWKSTAQWVSEEEGCRLD